MLPPHYDRVSAAASLLTISEERADALSGGDGAHTQLGELDLSSMTATRYTEPLSWRLSTFDTEMQKMEPVLLRIQGIITDTILPPIQRPSNQASIERMRPHLRQSVSITGLGCHIFQKAVEQLEKIQVMMSNDQPEGTMQPWAPSFVGGNPVLNAHSRYFTRTVSAPNQESVDFDKDVDPDGYLTGMIDAKYIHTYDNRVEYYAQLGGTGREAKKITSTSPNSFRPGDIVEILAETCIFPTSTKSIFVLQLKALRLLNADHRNDAAILAMRARYTQSFVTHNRVPKRRDLYHEEEMVETGSSFKRMAVSDPKVDP